MQNYINQIRERLKWFIYNCSYADYDQQEVDFILDRLIQHQIEREELIESSCLNITINPMGNEIT